MTTQTTNLLSILPTDPGNPINIVLTKTSESRHLESAILDSPRPVNVEMATSSSRVMTPQKRARDRTDEDRITSMFDTSEENNSPELIPQKKFAKRPATPWELNKQTREKGLNLHKTGENQPTETQTNIAPRQLSYAQTAKAADTLIADAVRQPKQLTSSVNTRVKRDNAVDIKLKQGIEYKELIEIIKSLPNKKSIIGLAQGPSGWTEVRATSREEAIKICKTLDSNNKIEKAKLYETETTRVSLAWCRFDTTNICIKNEIEKYTPTRSNIFKVTLQELPWIQTGKRYVYVDTEKLQSHPMPSYIKVNNNTLLVNYQGQIKTCKRCEKEGHFWKECPLNPPRTNMKAPLPTATTVMENDEAGVVKETTLQIEETDNETAAVKPPSFAAPKPKRNRKKQRKTKTPRQTVEVSPEKKSADANKDLEAAAVLFPITPKRTLRTTDASPILPAPTPQNTPQKTAMVVVTRATQRELEASLSDIMNEARHETTQTTNELT